MPALEGRSWPSSTDQLLDRILANRWLPLAANIAAFVLLVYGLARWTWQLLEPAAPPTATVNLPLDSRQAALEIRSLLAAHIFGQLQNNTPVSTVNPERLPLSSLNLVLTGVMARGPQSFAFLSVNGAAETPVLVGQDVTAGAILEAVYPDRVVLRRGSALESVLLKDSDSTLPAGSIVASSPPNAGNAVRPLGGGTFSVDRQGLTQNLTAETLSQATVAPSAAGLVVRDVQSGSVFEKLGLRAGDVVRNINGQSVTNLEDVMKAYSQFASSTQAVPIAVEVSRGGKTEVLQYRMQ